MPTVSRGNQGRAVGEAIRDLMWGRAGDVSGSCLRVDFHCERSGHAWRD